MEEQIVRGQMMTLSLYKYFGCKNKEELLYKMVTGSEDVKPLIQLYEELGKQNNYIAVKITTAEQMATYAISSESLPKEGYLTIMVTNIKNRPISSISLPISKIEKNEINVSEVLKKCYNDIMSGMVVISNEKKDIRHLNKWQDAMKKIHLNVLDYFYVENKNNKYRLMSVNDTKALVNISKKNYNAAIQNVEKVSLIDSEISLLQNLSEYEEFTNYYTSHMLKGLNIVKDIKRIKELLYISGVNKTFEEFCSLSYNKYGNILDNKIHTRGDYKSVRVNRNTLIKELIDDETSGIIIYHNHPSANSDASRDDFEMTETVAKRAKALNKRLYDSLIIGKDEVRSIAKSGEIDILSTMHNEQKDMLSNGVSEAFVDYEIEELEV